MLVLKNIRAGLFDPDKTRSGMFAAESGQGALNEFRPASVISAVSEEECAPPDFCKQEGASPQEPAPVDSLPTTAVEEARSVEPSSESSSSGSNSSSSSESSSEEEPVKELAELKGSNPGVPDQQNASLCFIHVVSRVAHKVDAKFKSSPVRFCCGMTCTSKHVSVPVGSERLGRQCQRCFPDTVKYRSTSDVVALFDAGRKKRKMEAASSGVRP